MPKRKTHEEFVEQIKNINSNIEILGSYINDNTKILCKCKLDGYEWYAKPSKLLQKRGCPKCAGNIKKTHEGFVEEMAGIHPNIEVLGKYINNKTKVLCKCKIDGYEWESIPNSLLQGHGCTRCAILLNARKISKTHEQFIKELTIINPNIEILNEYINAFTKLKCKCKICNNKWNATPHQLLYNHGCPKCSRDLVSLKLSKTHEQFISDMTFKNSDIEILSEYINNKTKILCRCKTCEFEWSTTPNSLLSGVGCPKCNKISKGEKAIECFLLNNNIVFNQQYRYNGLFGVNGGQLSYDFYLPDYNLLIEYQGKQHEKSIDYFGGEEYFEIQQEHDNRKRVYAGLHSINLLEIWYWDFDNIEDILISRLMLEKSA